MDSLEPGDSFGSTRDGHVGDCLATYLQRYEAIYRQASAQYGGMEALLPAPAISEKALPRSKRRAVPEVREPGTSTAPERDDVEIVSLPTVSIKKAYSTVDILRAISSARSPFKYSAAMAMDLYAVASSETVNAERRELLLTFAEWFDGVASLDPRIMLMQGFSDAARMTADLLEGKTLTPEDMLGLTNTFKVTMTIRRFSPSSVVRMKTMSEKALASAKLGGRVEDKTDAKASPPVESVGDISYSYFNALGDRLTPVPERVYSPAAAPAREVFRGEIQAGLLSESGEPVAVEQSVRVAEQAQERRETPPRWWEEVLGPARQGRPKIMQHEQPLSNRYNEEAGMPGRDVAPVEHPLNAAFGEESSAHRERGEDRGNVRQSEGISDPEEADVRFFDLAYAESARADLESGPEQQEMERGSDQGAVDAGPEQGQRLVEHHDAPPHGSDTLARPAYAMTDGIPLYREMDGQAFLRWRPMPLERYRIEGMRVKSEPGIFYDEGSAYVQFGEHCYAVRDLGQDDWHIVSRKGHLLPPLPVVRHGEQLVLRRPVPAVFDGAEAQAIVGKEAPDGFVRYGNKKFAMANGMLVAVDRANIVGEKIVASLAIAIDGHVGPADAMGIISTQEHGAVIEGARGYYRLLKDVAVEKFFLVGAQGERPSEVEYDVDTSMWRIVDVHSAEEVVDENLAHTNDVGESSDAHVVSHVDARAEEPVVHAPLVESDMPHEAGQKKGLPTVVISGADGEVEAFAEPAGAQSSSDENASIALARRWSIRSADSLERYRFQARFMPFLERHPRLRFTIRKAFSALASANLHRSNRLGVLNPSNLLAIPIRHIREQIFLNMPNEKKWAKMTLRQKQKAAAEATFQVYLADATRWAFFEPTAFCHEMVDMATWYLIADRQLKMKVLQIAFRDLSGSGMTHVALIYAEFPALLERFGDMVSTKAEEHVHRPRLGREEFEQFLFDQRSEMIVIDPWASGKLLDFSGSTRLADVQALLGRNLQEAKFSTELPLNYEVRAVLPDRTQAKPHH